MRPQSLYKEVSQQPRPLLVLRRGTYPPPVPRPTSGGGSTVACGDFFSPWQSSNKFHSAHLAYRKNCLLVALSLRNPTIQKVGVIVHATQLRLFVFSTLTLLGTRI